MTNKIKTFKNVEFLRFAMTWTIVWFHAWIIKAFVDVGMPINWATGGFKAVEMFFLIAGFFMFLKLHTEQSTWEFWKKKWVRLAPLVILSALLTSFFLDGHFRTKELLEALLIRTWGFFPIRGSLGGFQWFICDLAFISLVYFYIAKSIPQKYMNMVVFFIMYISANVMLFPGKNGGYILLDIDMARGFLYMGVGYFLANAYKSINSQNLLQNTGKTICYSIAEVSLFLFVMMNLFTLREKEASLQLAFIALFLLFIHRKGWFSRLLEKDWAVLLGRYAYAIYCVHIFALQATAKFIVLPHKGFFAANHWAVFLISSVVVMALAVLAHHFVEVPAIRWFGYKKSIEKV
ncbi:MAG: acyltransferase family protein [Elusimicrobiota bacterium]|jgi:peptidoglycan/LPS O-acetylase OafA/YrhL|nr:acyltransferase family protein [Elusimicrobiota bacterium]